ncbi:hypothetical protein FHR84_003701 [Actinopolyspora biskrensis]|uniref:Uncharacterized protein n=1 Tax=Actinopolyspora biskrensis TaxID=1470178 RepID=A0A852YZ49_9ACTN|nr:hypothetical protein [Actinopolyspora biskrensis]
MSTMRVITIQAAPVVRSDRKNKPFFWIWHHS